jgi:nucleoside-diphosphate-sugar epimerase
MKKMERVLVVGGAGYVGSRLVPMLLGAGYSVTVMDTFWFWDKRSDYLNAILNELGEPVDLLQKDIRYLESLPDIFDYVINLACISNDPSSDLDQDFTHDVSYNGVCNLISIVERDCKKLKKFIQASSDSVYGIKEEMNVTEDLEPAPLTQYSTLKLWVEEYLAFKVEQNNFPCVIVRPSTICGYSPRQRLDLMINTFIDQAINKYTITLHGGSQYRPFIHIKDMCRVYLHLLKEKIFNGEIYNASHSYKTAKRFAEEIAHNTNAIIKQVDIQDTRSYRSCSNKICNDLGFKFEYGVYDAIEELSYAFSQDKIDRTRSINMEIMKKYLNEITNNNLDY